MFAVLQGQEILLIAVIIMVLFGSTQIPKLARSLGQAQREFKTGLENAEADTEETADKS